MKNVLINVNLGSEQISFISYGPTTSKFTFKIIEKVFNAYKQVMETENFKK